jgi:hypothetical protein
VRCEFPGLAFFLSKFQFFWPTIRLQAQRGRRIGAPAAGAGGTVDAGDVGGAGGVSGAGDVGGAGGIG